MASNSKDPSITDNDDEYQVQYDDEEEDDERTIEEEEQLGSDEEEDELDNLQADADMPLDELLKLYGQNSSIIHNKPQDDDESSISSEEEHCHGYRHQIHHLLPVNGQMLPESDDDDDTDDSFEPEIIKTINIGEEYQAQVEPQTTNEQYNDAEVPVDELLWSSFSVNNDDNEKIDEYLRKIRNEFPVADDEISLQTLLNCHMDTDSALVKFRSLPVKTIYAYSEWSPDEIEHLEDGLREYDKNFHNIRVYKCPNRSVREIIHFYYQWKKSDRYKLFIEEQQRLSAILSVIDMIQRLIEQQEEEQSCITSNVNSSTNTFTICSNDLKRNSPNSSISIVTIHQQEMTTTKRTFDQVENDIEPSSKKPAINVNSSSTTTVV